VGVCGRLGLRERVRREHRWGLRLYLVVTALQAETGDLSAAETAERVGISRVSARRYLEHLCVTGQAQQKLRYGTSGRPEHRYRWGSEAPR